MPCEEKAWFARAVRGCYPNMLPLGPISISVPAARAVYDLLASGNYDEALERANKTRLGHGGDHVEMHVRRDGSGSKWLEVSPDGVKGFATTMLRVYGAVLPYVVGTSACESNLWRI